MLDGYVDGRIEQKLGKGQTRHNVNFAEMLNIGLRKEVLLSDECPEDIAERRKVSKAALSELKKLKPQKNSKSPAAAGGTIHSRP